MSYLSFISDEDLLKHIHSTLATYSETIKSIDLKKFNSNLVDPIKLSFDSIVYNKSLERILEDEIARQRDKTNTNAIGYFHQNIFKYIKNCNVPPKGYDVVYSDFQNKRKIYVEMKNKHNTMNSSSSQRTYVKLSNAIMNNNNDMGFLVEVIAKKSQNIPWNITIDNQKFSNERIRRVSIDKFYELITGENSAFYNLCRVLPKIIKDIVLSTSAFNIERDTVLEELKKINPDLLWAVYLLTFKTYEGFE